MAFSQRARAYTLNPTLPCPTLPLSPRALSDSSIIPAAGRLCLEYEPYEPFWSERRMECELIRRKDRSELAPTCTAPGETMRAGTTLIP